jgi:prevent-host-death family protein
MGSYQRIVSLLEEDSSPQGKLDSGPDGSENSAVVLNEEDIQHVSLGDLRRDLSAWIEEVRKGRALLVTRRGRPVARITGPLGEHVHIGREFGRGGIKPLFDRPPAGRSILDLLFEDRCGSLPVGGSHPAVGHPGS